MALCGFTFWCLVCDVEMELLEVLLLLLVLLLLGPTGRTCGLGVVVLVVLVVVLLVVVVDVVVVEVLVLVVVVGTVARGATWMLSWERLPGWIEIVLAALDGEAATGWLVVTLELVLVDGVARLGADEADSTLVLVDQSSASELASGSTLVRFSCK